MTRPFRAAAALVVTVAFVVPIATPGPALAEDHRNEIKGLAFNPDQMTIRAGDSVTWVNADADRHDLRGDGFPEPAQIAYHCIIHTYMEGKVIVLNPDGSVPPTTAGEPEAPPAPSTTTSSTRPPSPLDGVIERLSQ
jgi:plastocyanin